MGKTAKPCMILVMDQGLLESPEVQALRTKGHTVVICDNSEYDVIIGPQCWRVDPALGNLGAILEMVLKGVRAKKYTTKKAKP